MVSVLMSSVIFDKFAIPIVFLFVLTRVLIFVVIKYSKPVAVCITGIVSFLSSYRMTIPR